MYVNRLSRRVNVVSIAARTDSVVVRGLVSWPTGVLVAVPRVFFFQAEDGIRDTSVTGVQTCALPISRPVHVHRLGPDRPVWLSGAAAAPGEHRVLLPAGSGRAVGHAGGARQPDRAVPGEIGRASCRKGWRSWGERGGGEERESDE